MSARILVVNDRQEILELFRTFLEEEEGYEVILAGTPIQSIKEVEQINPDLIILDLIFGDEKTGLQMLQMLKMQKSTEPFPSSFALRLSILCANKRAISSHRASTSSTSLTTSITWEPM